ncbi:MAG: low molecular weight phosphatase family protein [Anaerolineae bacterium]|nr:MAG: low molecular weight phosphatase family protein [Anaerolineae bacterium]
MRNESKRVLFLCTGNYYRSRFAEDWFNHLAKKQGREWLAESRGLANDWLWLRNSGPMAPEAIHELEKRGAKPSVKRWPQALKAGEWRSFQRVIALNREEHKPLIAARFPELSDVTYWDIKDLGEEESASALGRLAEQVENLLRELRGQ